MKIQDWQNIENGFYSDLERCREKVRFFEYQLKQIKQDIGLQNQFEKEIHHFQQLFAFYRNDLIPVLEDMIRIGQKLQVLSRKNPDKSFNPFKLEVKYHHKLMKQFLTKFEQIKLEFEAFIKGLKFQMISKKRK